MKEPLVIKVTVSPGDLGDLADHPRVKPIGQQTLAEMEDLWAKRDSRVRSIYG